MAPIEVPPDRVRRKMRKFLKVYPTKDGGTISKTCAKVGIKSGDVRAWRLKYAEFNDEVIAAEHEIYDKMCELLLKQAGFYGEDEVVAWKNVNVNAISAYLKFNRPENLGGSSAGASKGGDTHLHLHHGIPRANRTSLPAATKTGASA